MGTWEVGIKSKKVDVLFVNIGLSPKHLAEMSAAY